MSYVWEREADSMNEDYDVISVYSQDQGVEDGFLVNVSELAKEAGFRIPVHITSGVQALCEVPHELEGTQDYTGRLWDVLVTSAQAYRVKRARLLREERPEEEIINALRLVEFFTFFQMPTGMVKERLWMTMTEGVGFTIMQPEEY